MFEIDEDTYPFNSSVDLMEVEISVDSQGNMLYRHHIVTDWTVAPTEGTTDES